MVSYFQDKLLNTDARIVWNVRTKRGAIYTHNQLSQLAQPISKTKIANLEEQENVPINGLIVKSFECQISTQW